MVYEKIYLKEHFDFLKKDDKNSFLEVYLPYNMSEMNWQDKKRPCILICPGGGYAMCSQRESEPIALKFLGFGFNVFVLTYSVAPNRFPTQLLEVASAMELIYNNADKWNCDTEKIAIMGFSAGGHLAAHYSTVYDCPEIRKIFPESKRVNASVLCYPVITADPKHSHKGSFLNLLGKEVCKEDIEKFSCDRNVSEKTPPAFIWHTAADAIVSVKNSLLYADALNKCDIPFELHIYPFGYHGLATSDAESLDDINEVTEYNKAWVKEAAKWLKHIFKLK